MSQLTTLDQWLSYLEGMHPTEIDLGLDRIQQVADRLELNSIAPEVITVAGTNGKGTSCAFLEAYSKKQGKSVGLYTSPHLIRFNERVRINLEEVQDSAFIDAFESIEQARGEISLTYFEYSTLAALWIFKQSALDVVILEVGLGGRLDAVNIIDPDLALVTSISVDHEAWLGSDIEKIGREKAGIFRANVPAVYGAVGQPASIGLYADEVGASFFQAGSAYETEYLENTWAWKGQVDGWTEFDGLVYPSFPVQNVATCIAGLSALGWTLDREALNWAIENAYIRGRMEPFEHQGVTGWLDVAHNPDAAAHLANQLSKKAAKGIQRVAIFGCMADKDIDGVIDELEGSFDQWLCINLPLDRAIDSVELVNQLSQRKLDAVDCKDFETAFKYCRSVAQVQDLQVVVLGSFFTVAEAILYYER